MQIKIMTKMTIKLLGRLATQAFQPRPYIEISICLPAFSRV